MDHEKFGKYIKKSKKLASKNFTQLQDKSEMEKIEFVLNYMKSNYKYNGINNIWASKSIKQFTTQKTGNSANINLMALGILQHLGVNCKPIIISTRDHGKVYEDFPFTDLFNDVLILFSSDEKSLILDATDPYCPTNIIPANCCNGKGFIIDEEKEQWANIYNKTPSKDLVTLNYKYNEEAGLLEGKAKIKTTGHIAISEKKEYLSKEEKFIDQLNSKGLTINDSIKVTSDNSNLEFEYVFNFTSPADQIEAQIIFTPLMNLPIQENPFKQKNRDYSIDFVYPFIKGFQAFIELPDGYKFDNIPINLNRNSKNVAFSYKISQNDNKTLIISSSYQIKKPIYSASVYNELKLFYKTLTEKLYQSIVISKI